jgi:hypothetical protein
MQIKKWVFCQILTNVNDFYVKSIMELFFSISTLSDLTGQSPTISKQLPKVTLGATNLLKQ